MTKIIRDYIINLIGAFVCVFGLFVVNDNLGNVSIFFAWATVIVSLGSYVVILANADDFGGVALRAIKDKHRVYKIFVLILNLVCIGIFVYFGHLFLAIFWLIDLLFIYSFFYGDSGEHEEIF